MSEQIAVRMSADLAASLDELVESGRFETKAGAVRAAIEAMVDRERRGRIGDEIAAGYRRHPQADDEVDAAREAAVRSIHEEPW